MLLELLAALPSDTDLAVVRRDGKWVVGLEPERVVSASGVGALDALDRLGGGWWAGFLAYDLGRAVERVVGRLPDDLGLPDVLLARFNRQLVFEAPGDSPDLSEPDLVSWSSSLSREAYEAGVRAVVALVEAGQCYQVNLTRRLTCERAADPVALFASLVRRNPAPHPALLRFGGVAVVSASPERFLRRRGQHVETRPIKGTGTEAAALAASAKDRAENVMIADLARNDLGRVCEFGTVAVPALCALEEHPGLWHLVSTVTGRLRPGVRTGALVRATFPPASVTGAPKPRVLQAIEDLEPVRRGVYCGAVGWMDDDHDEMDLNVAIRTFTVAGGRTHLGVGGGIVADSDPAAEWRETELKAARLLAAAGAEALVGAT